MKKLLIIAAAAAALAGCGRQLNPAEREEARRAELELQGVMDMVSSKQIPPVEFELGSARLLPTSFALLDKVAAILLSHNRLKLIVSGHTDASGSEGFNETLALQRASSVKMYLARKGVYPESVRVYGYGESQPLLNEDSERAHADRKSVV